MIEQALRRAFTIATGVLSLHVRSSGPQNQQTATNISKATEVSPGHFRFTILKVAPGSQRIVTTNTIEVFMVRHRRAWRCERVITYFWDNAQNAAVRREWTERRLVYFNSWKTLIPEHYWVPTARWTSDRSGLDDEALSGAQHHTLPTVTTHQKSALCSCKIRN